MKRSPKQAPSRFDSALGWTGNPRSRLIRVLIAAVLLTVCYRRAARLRLAFVHAFRPAADRWLEQWVEACLARPQPP